MLMLFLTAATLVISPTWRADDAGHDNFGVAVEGYRSSATPWSGGLFYEHARANTFVSGNATYMVPRVQTFGTTVSFELAGRPYFKSRWGWVRNGSRLSLAATLRLGARRFSYDFPASIGPQTREWILDIAKTGYFATPGVTSRFSIARPIALQTSLGWEFGSSGRSYERLQASIGLSTQF